MGSIKFGSMFFIAPDKSISHRALFFAALSKQKGCINNLSVCDDVIRTINCLVQLGLKYHWDAKNFHYDSTTFPSSNNLIFNCGNSGTTARLLIGLLVGLNINATVTGDKSLSMRPMLRMINPLVKMGANISHTDGKLPVQISHTHLKNNLHIENLTPSAQVKSAIILAALASKIHLTLVNKHQSRDHTERMAAIANIHISADLTIKPSTISLPKTYEIYGDPSSAFFLAAAAILKQKSIVLKNIYLNPTRIEAFNTLIRMGARITFSNPEILFNEMVGDIEIKPSKLHAIDLDPKSIPKLIDEIPMLAILCCFAKGKSKLNGLEELKYKESNRLELIYNNLKSLSASIALSGDDLTIENSSLEGGTTIQTDYDHRIVMAFEILNLALEKKNIIPEKNCVKISFPNFYDELEKFNVSQV